MLPLDFHRQTQMARLWFRCQSLYGDPTYNAVTDISRDATFTQHPHFPQPFGFRARGVLEVLSLPRPAMAVPRLLHVPPWKLLAVSYCRYMPANKSTMSEHAARTLFTDHASVHEGCTPIFTYGSRSDAGVGFGVVFLDFTRCGSLYPFTSIFTAELWAILVAIRSLFILDVGGFVIFTDFRAALSALEDFNNAHSIVSDIFNWFVLATGRGHKISFCWVPVHVSVKENDKADELANTGASRQVTACPVLHRPVFRNSICY